MMKRLKLAVLLCVLTMCLFVPAVALAADDIGVQLNGDALTFTDAVPVNENGRVYVPFRAVLEGLGAEVDYRAEDGLIMAEKGGTKVMFQVNQPYVTVDNGTENTITIDAPPFIRNGRTYVPIRFAAQTLGLEVGWDSTLQTVVMLDKAELKEQAKGQYTLMDKYMKYMQMQNLNGNVKSDGTLQFDMQVADGSGDASAMVPVTGTMKLNGKGSKTAVDINVAMNLNLDNWLAAVQNMGEVTAEQQAAMEAMKNMTMQVRGDTAGGYLYLQSDMFALSGLNGSAWYRMDLDKTAILSGSDLKNVLADNAYAQNSCEKTVMAMIDSLTPENATTCQMVLNNLEMYRDDAFQKTGNNYVSSMRYTANGMTTSMSITLKTNGAAVTGYQEASSLYMGNAPLMMLKNDMTGSRSDMEMSLTMQNMLTMKLKGNVQYSAGSEKPQTAPPSGAQILNFV
ncbi:MAG: copper amine oxidase N-terminal domain-containing protein [Peptococcaceae bacterium]|nr:copper amine oxidase N-terminal domain-containing protein [Peptococcaceae bacterium]